MPMKEPIAKNIADKGGRQEWFPIISVSETDKRLYATHSERMKETAHSPCCLMPEDIDCEMSTGKNTEMLEICGMTQEGLEHFVSKYGKTYRFLSLFKCQLISDLSPLGDLEHLEEVNIYWNIRCNDFWDMSRNTALKRVRVNEAKKMILDPTRLKTSRTLERIVFGGGEFDKYPMESLACFSDMVSLKSIGLCDITLKNHSVEVLKTLPSLEVFDFGAGMLTTEEIAWIVAKYPHLKGRSLCPFNKADATINDVRICGYRKPGLDLPRDQKRLDKYVAEFDALVEKYRAEGTESSKKPL